jgi:hypothetical protein
MDPAVQQACFVGVLARPAIGLQAYACKSSTMPALVDVVLWLLPHLLGLAAAANLLAQPQSGLQQHDGTAVRLAPSPSSLWTVGGL